MTKVLATVTQEGRFLKAITTEGVDVSNQIDRGIRKAALAQQVPVQWDDVTRQWMLATSQPIPVPVETLEADDSHDEIKKFIQRSPALKPAQLIMSDVRWKYLVRSAMRGKNILMVGPSGSGKTVAAKYLVTALDRPEFYFNLGATQDPRATLIGNTHFSKESGTYFAESLFVKAIQTENAIILLDELSRAHPEAWNILMTVLDLNQRYLRLDEAEGSPTIKVAEGVSFIATANIGNEYTSTRVMDKALLDRVITIEMDMLDETQEFDLLRMKYPAVDQYTLKAIAEIAGKTRSELKSSNPKLSDAISTRVSVEVASLIYDGFTLAEAAEVAIYPKFNDDGGVESERTFVKQIVQKYCVNPDAAPATLFTPDDINHSF